jgi:hypothetical protein
MTKDSYTHGRTTGLSDGTTAGIRGADDYRVSQRHLERNSQLLQGQQAGADRMHEEGRKLGELLTVIVAGLFLHRYFCFVGFWLVCFGLLLALPAYLPLPDAVVAALTDWYAYFAAVVPLILAWLLRKIIPTLMKWIFFAALAAIVIALIVEVARSR